MDDTTDRINAGDELRANPTFFTSLIDNAPVAIYVKDVRPQSYGTMLVWNKRTEAITGLSARDVIGRKDRDFLAPAVQETIRRRDRELFANPVVQERDEEPYRRPDGTVIFLHTISVPLLGADGMPEFILRISEDVTARRRQQKEINARTAELEALTEALSISEHRLRTITDTIPASVAYIDRDERYQFTNAAFERAFGLGRDQIRGRTMLEMVGPERYAILKPFVDRVMSGETVTFERERHGPHGLRWLESTYIPELSEHGDHVVGFHAMLHDITAKKLEAERLTRLAQIDGLTGIANRVGFDQRLADAMASSRASGEPLALMYVDIDRFKPINDTYGHAAGDALLLEFAMRLKAAIRKSDIVARLGGDEFVIVTERVLEPTVASRLASKILDSMRRPFVVDERNTTLNVTASIGIAFYADSDATAEAVLDEADSMLYAAKKGGRNQYLMAPWPWVEIPVRRREPLR